MKWALLFLLPLALPAEPPILVELFTSEGCSSCPPADRLLVELEKTHQVIALSEHVDYWNRLGWRDPFSSAQFSERQLQYAKDGPYTPEMVVDGRAAFVGNNGPQALAAIADAAKRRKANVAIETAGPNINVKIDGIPAKTNAEIFLAITETGLSSNVTRGENAGHTLSHTGVVRRLVSIGKTKESSFAIQSSIPLAKDWNRQNLRAVVFIEDRGTHQILGAAATSFGAE